MPNFFMLNLTLFHVKRGCYINSDPYVEFDDTQGTGKGKVHVSISIQRQRILMLIPAES